MNSSMGDNDIFSEYNVKVEVSRTFFGIVMTIFQNREKGE